MSIVDFLVAIVVGIFVIVCIDVVDPNGKLFRIEEPKDDDEDDDL